MKIKNLDQKVSGVMDMLEEEFQILTAIEEGKIIGGGSGSGGDYGSGGGDYGSGGPVPEVSVTYREHWNADHTLMTPQVSFDHGTSWVNCDVAINPAALEPIDSGGGMYNVDTSSGVGNDWYGDLGTGDLGSDTINTILGVIEEQEGGFVYTDYSDDPPTYAGITIDTFSDYADDFGLSNDINGLKSMNIDQVTSIYEDKYWNNIDADQITNEKFAQELFSLNVNCGGHSIEALQRTLNNQYGCGLVIDGAMGPNTLNALNSVFNNPQNTENFINSFNQEMKDTYRGFENFDKYGEGWLNRVDMYSWDNFYQSSGN